MSVVLPLRPTPPSFDTSWRLAPGQSTPVAQRFFWPERSTVSGHNAIRTGSQSRYTDATVVRGGAIALTVGAVGAAVCGRGRDAAIGSGVGGRFLPSDVPTGVLADRRCQPCMSGRRPASTQCASTKSGLQRLRSFLHLTRHAYEPFGGIYARDYAMEPRRKMLGPVYWLWVLAAYFALSVAWSLSEGSWTKALCGLCVASFLGQCYSRRWEDEGVLWSNSLYAPEQQHRLLLSAFLHASWWHLACNLFSLWYVGRLLEPIFGPGRFVFLYLGSALGSSFASAFVGRRRRQQVASAGASGAVYGLIAALAIYRLRNGIPLGNLWTSAIVAVALAAIQPNVDHVGHAGGAASGAAIGFLWGPRYMWSLGGLLVREAPIITFPFA